METTVRSGRRFRLSPLLPLPRLAHREVLGDLLEARPAHARMPADLVEDALMHQQHMQLAGDVRMDRHGENHVVILAIDPV